MKAASNFDFYVNFHGYSTSEPTAGFNGWQLVSYTGAGAWQTVGFTFTAGAYDAGGGTGGAVNLAMGALLSNSSMNAISIPGQTVYYYDWEIGPV